MPETADPARTPGNPSRSKRAAALGLAAVVGLMAVALGLRALDEHGQPTGEASWIWSEHSQPGEPIAFLAARDFELDAQTVETKSLDRARLVVQGDESYQVYVNGSWVGAGEYRVGEQADVFRVDDRLRQGLNRIAIEARSYDGAGGLLVALLVGTDPEPVIVTDGRWRIFGTHRKGLIEGWRPLRDGEPPLVLGRPPVGRWQRPELGPEQPAQPMEAESRWAVDMEHLVVPAEDGEGEESFYLIDFGETVDGYAELWRDGGACNCGVGFLNSRDRLLTELRKPPRHRRRLWDGMLVALPGGERWRDTTPRRFRYLLVHTHIAPLSARVRERAAWEEDRVAEPVEGVWGFALPGR